ncbi:MAG TPA: ABC transporter substrate binding protein [Rhodocyclaceae bacterium]
MMQRAYKAIGIAWFAACAFCWALGASAAPPGSRNIAVLYPDIGDPYRGVFTRIIEGVEEQTKGRVVSVAVGSNANPQEIAGELRQQDVRVVIALGRNGLRLAGGLDIPVIAGGVISVPESDVRNIPVFSLAPDPGLLFARLQNLMPAARRIFVVFDPRQNAWLLRFAKEAAAARGFELVAYEASDLKSALRLYQEVFAAMDPRRDALWLPQDSTTVDEASVLPLVLQEAWSRSLAVFSSSVVHVRRGALFSLYPDNLQLGHSLGSAAQSVLAANGATPRGVTPLRSVLTAVNVRTASHLGLNLSGRQQGIDMVFPEP